MIRSHRKLGKVFSSPFTYIFCYFFIRLPSLNDGLNDAYAFRQTQTAWGIREVQRTGVDFFHLRMPTLGQPYQVPFEFPLFQNLAGLLAQTLDISPESSGRTLSLFFYCGGLFVLVMLSKNIIGDYKIKYFLPLMFFSPYALEWSVACLIESTAVFFLLLGLLLVERYLYTFDARYLCGSILPLALAALVKITSVIPILFFFVIFLFTLNKARLSYKDFVKVFLILTIAVIPAFFWTWYADSIKSQSQLSVWLTSDNLRTWNFGSVKSRFLIDNWASIAGRIWIILGSYVFLLIYTSLTINRKNVSNWVILFTVCAPFLIFFNLYVVHDYYFLAIYFLLFFAASYSVIPLFSSLGFDLSRKILWSVTAITLIGSFAFQIPNRNYIEILKMDKDAIPILSSSISNATKPSDNLLVVGCDWDPSILYFADRMGIAAPSWTGSVVNTIKLLTRLDMMSEISYIATCGDVVMPKTIPEITFIQVAPNLFQIKFDRF